MIYQHLQALADPPDSSRSLSSTNYRLLFWSLPLTRCRSYFDSYKSLSSYSTFLLLLRSALSLQQLFRYFLPSSFPTIYFFLLYLHPLPVFLLQLLFVFLFFLFTLPGSPRSHSSYYYFCNIFYLFILSFILLFIYYNLSFARLFLALLSV